LEVEARHGAGATQNTDPLTGVTNVGLLLGTQSDGAGCWMQLCEGAKEFESEWGVMTSFYSWRVRSGKAWSPYD